VIVKTSITSGCQHYEHLLSAVATGWKAEHLVDGVEQGIRLVVAPTAEVVRIDGPHHHAAQLVGLGVVCLRRYCLLVVVHHPLVVAVRILDRVLLQVDRGPGSKV
jgi:hypothetical protein